MLRYGSISAEPERVSTWLETCVGVLERVAGVKGRSRMTCLLRGWQSAHRAKKGSSPKGPLPGNGIATPAESVEVRRKGTG